MHTEMRDKIGNGRGFIAALDQSGGSTPKALEQYGVSRDAYSDDEEMFEIVHRMRTRIITSPVFAGDRILGAILFEGTMAREIEGVPSATYLWRTKQVVPFVKVDQGLAEAADGVRLMKPLTDLDDLLARSDAQSVFGTKMRSVIERADPGGIEQVVAQQFEVAQRLLDAGLMPIIEPEVDIHAPDKGAAEELLREQITARLDHMSQDHQVMLKLTIPSVDGFHTPLIEHPRVLRVVALSGGYRRDEANERLARNPALIASFSRALIGELRVDQSDEEFDAALEDAISTIYAASTT